MSGSAGWVKQASVPKPVEVSTLRSGVRRGVVLSVALIVSLLLVGQSVVGVVALRSAFAGQNDLRAFYAAGTIARMGNSGKLYDYGYVRSVEEAVVGPRTVPGAGALPFLYPPAAALLFVPLSLLTFKGAVGASLAVNAGLLCLSAWLLAPLITGARWRWPVLAAVWGCLFAVTAALVQGQISFLLLAVICLCYRLLREDRAWLAGALLSVAMLKFQLALPMVLLFVLWRRWRMVGGFAVGSGALGLLSIAMVGPDGLRGYAQSLAGVAMAGARDAAAAKLRYGMLASEMPNLHGLTFALSGGRTWGMVLDGLLCLAVVVWAARQRASLPVAVGAAMLVSYHMPLYDLTLLLLPLSLVGGELAERWRSGRRRRLDGWLVGSLFLLTLPLAGLMMLHDLSWVACGAVAMVMVGASSLHGGDIQTEADSAS